MLHILVSCFWAIASWLVCSQWIPMDPIAKGAEDSEASSWVRLLRASKVHHSWQNRSGREKNTSVWTALLTQEVKFSEIFYDLLLSSLFLLFFSIFFSYFLSVQLVHLLVEIEKATMRRVCGSWNVWGWHTEKAPGRGSMAYHCDKKHETNRVGLEACHFCAIYVYMYIR